MSPSETLRESLQRLHEATLAGRGAQIIFDGDVLSGTGVVLRINNRDGLAGQSTGPILVLQFFDRTKDDSVHRRFCESAARTEFAPCPESAGVIVIGWGEDLGSYRATLDSDVARAMASVEKLLAELCSPIGEDGLRFEFAVDDSAEGDPEDLEEDDEEIESDDDEEEDEQSQSACPLCGEEDSCNHLLLLIDHTFQTLEGGVFYDDVDTARGRFWEVLEAEPDERVKQAFQGAGLDFDEWRGALREGEFDAMFLDYVREVVGRHTDAESKYEIDDSPGQASAYLAYWSESANQSRTQIRKELLDPVGGS